MDYPSYTWICIVKIFVFVLGFQINLMIIRFVNQNIQFLGNVFSVQPAHMESSIWVAGIVSGLQHLSGWICVRTAAFEWLELCLTWNQAFEWLELCQDWSIWVAGIVSGLISISLCKGPVKWNILTKAMYVHFWLLIHC